MKTTGKKTNSLLKTDNLIRTVNFATRIRNDSRTTIDNIFVDSIRFSSSSTSPVINGLSDHDAQYLMINNIAAASNLIPLKQRTRKVNNETIVQFQLLLESEIWESVYKDDTNNRFNSFAPGGIVHIATLLFYLPLCCPICHSAVLSATLLSYPPLCCPICHSAVLSATLLSYLPLCCPICNSAVLSATLLSYPQLCCPICHSAVLSATLWLAAAFDPPPPPMHTEWKRL
jgi:hypothetical protein